MVLGHKRRYSVDSLQSLWKKLDVEQLVFSPFNSILFPAIALLRILNLRTSVPGKSDLFLPSPRINYLLYRIFSIERTLMSFFFPLWRELSCSIKEREMDQIKKFRSILLPSIADILFLSVFLLLSFSTGKGLLNDADTGYHIRTGEFILATLSVPRHDLFSFTSPPIPWTAHEWLSEVIMAIIHRFFGLTGIVIFFAFVIASAYYLLFKMIRTYKGNILIAASVIILAIASSQIHWLARPHIFSLFLMVIWYCVLDAYQYKDKNHLYVLPVIMLLWVNLHGGFIAGFMLLGVYLSCNLLRLIAAKGIDKEKWKAKSRPLGLALAGCLLAALINPVGYHILLFPFKLTSMKFLMDNVSEFVSPNFHEPMAFKYMLFLMMGVFAVSIKALNIIETSLILLFTYMALYSARYIPLFAIIATPILTKQIEALMAGKNGWFVEFIKKRADRMARADASAKGYLWPFLGILFIAVLAINGKVGFEFDKKRDPVQAVEFLKKEPISGNMFNNDQFGDYIIYAAWPRYRVFFDGRSDMYGEERAKEYFKVMRIKAGWEKY